MPFLLRDGVRLSYEKAGSGGPPFLFVHGWSCDKSYFAPQFDYFTARHQAISVDLRGHGESDKPDDGEYSMAIFADDLAWLCEQLEIDKPVVVGHSMGGLIAFEMAHRHPAIVGAVIAVDAPLLRSDEWNTRILSIADGLGGPDYRSVARDFVGRMFLPTDDPTRKANVIAGMSSAIQHVMVASLRGVCACDTRAALSSWTGPALVIDAGSPNDAAQLHELCPQLVIGQTVGSGHFNQLEVPDQVNAMIERFVRISL